MENDNNLIPEQETDQLERKNRKLFNRALLFGLVVMLVALGFWLGFSQGKKEVAPPQEALPLEQTIIINQDREKNRVLDFSLFWKAWDLLKEKYVDSAKLDSRQLLYGAIKGLLQATGDPYTVFFDPEESKKFNEEIAGSFEGIGAEMGIKGGMLTIIAPLEGSPAEKAGLRAGDKVIKINGENSAEMGIEEAVDKIRGPKGTEVKLTIFRNGDKEAKEIAVQRDIINVKSVKAEFKDNGIAYVKISRFGEDTDREFNSAANQIINQKAKGIILDLRNNPGGYLDAAVNIASKMIPKDQVVVIEEDSGKNQKKLLTRGGDLLSQIPTIVIINEGSASASEILAGALREDRDNVTLVGKRSFGKGSVQELVPLPQDIAVKITVARWLTPKGEQINEVGINPDVEVDLTSDDYENNRDPQLDRTMEILKEKISH
ncbi:MAG: S41 family peptidase [Candidatus Moranbacteria bacterium]|nr:S41 family peptidase [Candidatus Moranbacteria bacterium]